MEEMKPTKITVEFYNKKISTEVDHSDVTLAELHDMWIEVVRAMGFHANTIKEIYDE